jgi:phenylpropionate dioxygenase-like ring-hydroxylating dioxygenase large terminal subunit
MKSNGALFHGFARVWTPVARSRDLGASPLPIKVAGEQLVLFRAEGGRAAALLDRCPHRGASLARGQVADGYLQCPFHGWRFDAAGAVRRVPFVPDVRHEKLATSAFPVLEASGVVFLFTGRDVDPPRPPLADAIADWEGRGAPILREDLFSAHWTRAMENALDFPHVSFVHHNAIGFAQRRHAFGEARMETNWEETSFGARLSATIDGQPAGELEYFFPNVMRLIFPGPKPRRFLAAVPVDATTTRMLAFGPPGLSLGDWLFKMVGGFVLQQDKRVVETQLPAEVPPAGTELSVRVDRATLSFRRLYDARLRHSTAQEASAEAAPVGIPSAVLEDKVQVNEQ